MYFVYIIQSLIDQSFYIGYSHNPSSRLLHHNLGDSRYTSSKKPWKLVYLEEQEDKKHAIIREYQLKKWKNKKALQKLIDKSKGPVV